MRILFVAMQYGRSYLQGTERYLRTLSQCLRNAATRSASSPATRSD